MKTPLRRPVLVALLALALSLNAVAAAVFQPSARAGSLRQVPADLWQEQQRIWTSPAHWHAHWRLLAAAAAVTALLIATDRNVSAALPAQGAVPHDSRIASNAGLAVLFAEAGGIYLNGWRTGSLPSRRNGLAALESAGNAAIVAEAAKWAARRQRPSAAAGHGDFWKGGDSFPSGHATLSWALAETLAMEHPHSPWMHWGNWSAAAAIGVLRVTGQRHFPADVFAGGLTGHEIGRDIARQLTATSSAHGDFDAPRSRMRKSVRCRQSHVAGPQRPTEVRTRRTASRAEEPPSTAACRHLPTGPGR